MRLFCGRISPTSARRPRVRACSTNRRCSALPRPVPCQSGATTNAISAVLVEGSAGLADDHLVLARAADGHEADLVHVVVVAQALDVLAGERAHAAEEARVDVALGQLEEQRADAAAVGGARRAQQHLDAVLQAHAPLVLQRIGTPAGERLAGVEQAQPPGLVEQPGAELRVRQLDEHHGALAHRLAEQVADAVLGDHVVHVGARHRGALAGQQLRADARDLAVVGGRGQADDRLAAGRARRAAQELGLRREPAVELAGELVGAGLAGEIDREHLRHRHHAVLRRDGVGIAHRLDGLEREQRVAVDDLEQPARAEGVAGDDAPALQALAPAVDDALVEQRHDGVGDGVGVDAEVAPVLQVPQRLVRDAAGADLQRRAVVDGAGDVARDALDHGLFGGCVPVLDHGRLDLDEMVDALEGQGRFAHRPRHRRVDFGDDEPGALHRRRRHVDRDAQAHEAVRVGRRHLHAGHVDRQAAVAHQFGQPRRRQRHVLDRALAHRRAHLAADEDGAVAAARRHASVGAGGQRAVGDEVQQLDVGRRRRQRLERAHQRARRGAGAADEDAVAGRNALHRGLGRQQAGPIGLGDGRPHADPRAARAARRRSRAR